MFPPIEGEIVHISIGLTLIGLVYLYFRYRPTRALAWYALSAWARANGDAAVTRRSKSSEYMQQARAWKGATDAK